MSQVEIRDKLLRAYDENRLVSVRIPSGDGLVIALERHMVEDAFAQWEGMGIARRASAFASVCRAVKAGVKRVKRNRASADDMDALAADLALWIGHELLYSDGEKHLAKGPDRNSLLAPTP